MGLILGETGPPGSGRVTEPQPPCLIFHKTWQISPQQQSLAPPPAYTTPPPRWQRLPQQRALSFGAPLLLSSTHRSRADAVRERGKVWLMALVALNPGAAGERAQGGCCCADAFAGSDTKVHKGRVPQGNWRWPRHLPWDKSPLFSHLVPVRRTLPELHSDMWHCHQRAG